MSTTTTEDPFAILGETLETAANTLESTTADARAAALRASAATRRAVGSGAYSVSYAVAYGAVFAATYLHDLLPVGSAVQRGFEDATHDVLTARDRRQVMAEADDPGMDAEEMPASVPPPLAAKPTPAAAAPRRRAKVQAQVGISRKTKHTVDKLADKFEAAE